MIDTARVLEQIERADHEEPFCRCGAPTRVVGRATSLWFVCSTTAESEAPRRRVFSLWPAADHTNRLLVDLAA